MPSRSDEVKTKLEKLIIDLKMEGRLQLPPERKLCSDFGVSRITAGKAIAQLVNEGILSRRQGSGTFITDSDAPPKDSVIGVLLRNSYHVNDPHFYTLIDAVSKKAHEMDMGIQIADRVIDQFAESEHSNRIVKGIDAGFLNGLLVISRMPSEILGALNRKAPLVVLNNQAGMGDVACVYPDFAMAGFIGTGKLVESGHRKLVFASDLRSLPDGQWRLSGCRMAMSAAGLGEPGILETGVPDAVFKKRLMELVEKERFTAAYCASTVIAFYLIKMLSEEGLQVPEDFSLVGTGAYGTVNDDFSRLTLVDLRWELMAGTAFEMLFSMMKGRTIKKNCIMIEPELREGESVCKIR